MKSIKYHRYNRFVSHRYTSRVSMVMAPFCGGPLASRVSAVTCYFSPNLLSIWMGTPTSVSTNPDYQLEVIWNYYVVVFVILLPRTQRAVGINSTLGLAWRKTFRIAMHYVRIVFHLTTFLHEMFCIRRIGIEWSRTHKLVYRLPRIHVAGGWNNSTVSIGCHAAR